MENRDHTGRCRLMMMMTMMTMTTVMMTTVNEKNTGCGGGSYTDLAKIMAYREKERDL